MKHVKTTRLRRTWNDDFWVGLNKSQSTIALRSLNKPNTQLYQALCLNIHISTVNMFRTCFRCLHGRHHHLTEWDDPPRTLPHFDSQLGEIFIGYHVSSKWHHFLRLFHGKLFPINQDTTIYSCRDMAEKLIFFKDTKRNQEAATPSEGSGPRGLLNAGCRRRDSGEIPWVRA